MLPFLRNTSCSGIRNFEVDLDKLPARVADIFDLCLNLNYASCKISPCLSLFVYRVKSFNIPQSMSPETSKHSNLTIPKHHVLQKNIYIPPLLLVSYDPHSSCDPEFLEFFQFYYIGLPHVVPKFKGLFSV